MKYATRGGRNIFQLFDTAEKKDRFVANRRRWLECQGRKVPRKKVGKLSGMTSSIKESWQKPLRAPRGL